MQGLRPSPFQDGKMPSCSGNRGVQIFHRSDFSVPAKSPVFLPLHLVPIAKGHELGTNLRCFSRKILHLFTKGGGFAPCTTI